MATAALVRRACDYTALALGEEGAAQLGVDLERLKRATFGWASLLTAVAVAAAGPIGFVGLLLPHLLRLAAGPDHRLLLPAALLGGGAFLVLADLAARTLLAPNELPVGVLPRCSAGRSSWLLRRRARRPRWMMPGARRRSFRGPGARYRTRAVLHDLTATIAAGVWSGCSAERLGEDEPRAVLTGCCGSTRRGAGLRRGGARDPAAGSRGGRGGAARRAVEFPFTALEVVLLGAIRTTRVSPSRRRGTRLPARRSPAPGGGARRPPARRALHRRAAARPLRAGAAQEPRVLLLDEVPGARSALSGRLCDRLREIAAADGGRSVFHDSTSPPSTAIGCCSTRAPAAFGPTAESSPGRG